MSLIVLFGVISLANTALLSPVAFSSNPNDPPRTQQGAKGREFKGQYSPNGAYKVQLKLLSSLAPPFETTSDDTTSEGRYIPNSYSEQRNGDGHIMVQTLSKDQFIPVLVEPPNQGQYNGDKTKPYSKDITKIEIPPLVRPGSLLIEENVRKNSENKFNGNSDIKVITHVPADSSLQGQYVPDNLEKRFDDGSDKPEIVTPHLVESPYGPVPAGSGLEGQHVADNREKLYDNGSDKVVLPHIVESPYGPVPAGSGLQGQYVPDNLEKRFDDGSDKAEIVTPHLVESPYGPVPAGSGLEGQHVPDNLEKRYDDGSDKAGTVSPRIVESPYGPVPAGSGLQSQYVPDNLEKRFDDVSDKAGSGLEGQHVPDNLEKLYDDGSDKTGTVSPRIVNSSQGPVPAGSGLEGQYVPDNLEKLYDDGSDKIPNSVYEKRFDDGLYRPKDLEKLFDDGLYRAEELAKRFDDGIVKF